MLKYNVLMIAETKELTLEEWERLRKELLEVRQVAQILNYSISHIYRLIDEGRILAVRRGGRWFIPRQSVEDYLRDHTEASM